MKETATGKKCDTFNNSKSDRPVALYLAPSNVQKEINSHITFLNVCLISNSLLTEIWFPNCVCLSCTISKSSTIIYHYIAHVFFPRDADGA